MPEIYTNSMLKDWKLCKRKYYFKYIKKIVIPKKEDNFELGKKVHALISYKLNGFDTSLLENTASKEILLHYKSILNHPVLSQHIFLTEWGFCANIKTSQNLLMGRIDAVFFNKNTNIYTIADWKTGMKIPENACEDEQAQIYLYSFFKARNDLKIDISPENLRFSFIKTPDLSESSIDFSQELYDNFENKFLKFVEEIKNCRNFDEFEEKNTCKFCEYRFMCLGKH